MTRGTPYFIELRRLIASRGGLFNAHLHLDRAGTLDDTLTLLGKGSCGDTSHLSLSAKHGLIPLIHDSPAYDPGILRERTGRYLDLMQEAGTSRVDTLVDVTDDRVGLGALDAFLTLKRERAGRIDLRVAAYNPLGFKEAQAGRWDLFVEGARLADFLAALPERDDRRRYPNHVGFEESCRKMLTLAAELEKPIHIHVDQGNDPSEAGVETVLRLMDELGFTPRVGEPWVWLVHAISPSTYDEDRFDRLLDDLSRHNAGVICCPSAAISMRQNRPVRTPTFNSIARVLEMLAAGVPVRIGSDNICDVTSPAGTVDLVDELFVLANALRFYDLDVLAGLGTGALPDASVRRRIADHVRRDAQEVQRALRFVRQDLDGPSVSRS